MALTRLRQRGQVTLPEPVRDQLHLKDGDLLRVSVDDGRMILEPVTPGKLIPVWIPIEHLDRLTGVVSLGGDAREDAERNEQ